MEWFFKIANWLFRGNKVSKEVCEEVQRKNAAIIARLDDCIEGEMRRTGERFKELKTDMRLGFDEVKQLIKDRS